MKIKNISYKGLDLSTELINSGIILDDIIFNVSARTQINPNQLFHGGKATKTLANLRLFTIYGKIVGVDSASRDTAMRVLNNYTGYIGIGEEYFQLKFEDFNGGEYKCQAKIYASPDFASRVGSKGEPTIDFNFELLSNTAEYISFEQKRTDETYSNEYVNGGVELGVELGDELGEFRGIGINNLGNFTARTRIEVNGVFTDLKIYNNTNNRFYGITGVYNNLIVDNTGNFTATSNGVDVSNNRMSGSTSILLNPGINEITLIANSDTSGLAFTCKYSDTYI